MSSDQNRRSTERVALGSSQYGSRKSRWQRSLLGARILALVFPLLILNATASAQDDLYWIGQGSFLAGWDDASNWEDAMHIPRVPTERHWVRISATDEFFDVVIPGGGAATPARARGVVLQGENNAGSLKISSGRGLEIENGMRLSRFGRLLVEGDLAASGLVVAGGRTAITTAFAVVRGGSVTLKEDGFRVGLPGSGELFEGGAGRLILRDNAQVDARATQLYIADAALSNPGAVHLERSILPGRTSLSTAMVTVASDFDQELCISLPAPGSIGLLEIADGSLLRLDGFLGVDKDAPQHLVVHGGGKLLISGDAQAGRLVLEGADAQIELWASAQIEFAHDEIGFEIPYAIVDHSCPGADPSLVHSGAGRTILSGTVRTNGTVDVRSGELVLEQGIPNALRVDVATGARLVAGGELGGSFATGPGVVHLETDAQLAPLTHLRVESLSYDDGAVLAFEVRQGPCELAAADIFTPRSLTSTSPDGTLELQVDFGGVQVLAGTQGRIDLLGGRGLPDLSLRTVVLNAPPGLDVQFDYLESGSFPGLGTIQAVYRAQSGILADGFEDASDNATLACP